jgi:hypothetical protein
MPISSNIPLDKHVKLKALDRLRTVTSQSIDLRRSNAEQIHVDLLIEIFNPSIFSVALGELRFSMQFDEQIIDFVQSTSDDKQHAASQMELSFRSSVSYNRLPTNRTRPFRG